MKQVDTLMRQAISDKVFPGGVLLVSRDHRIVLHRAYGFADLFSRRKMTTATVFDLASLTKPLATALALMLLVQQKKIELDQELGTVLPMFHGDPKHAIKICDLLYHRSGLADYRPFYKAIENLPAGERRQALRNLLVKEPLINPIGSKTLYSDLGFMILDWVIERVSGRRLDHYVAEMIYRPLGLETLFFVDLNEPPPVAVFAVTEQCAWRKTLITGQVHDENAWVVGGIQGHAGLFGTAGGVHKLLCELLSAYHGNNPDPRFETDVVRIFFKRLPDTDKALGFDAPALKNSSCGRYFSKNSVGHLGFTGTSFWMDLDRSVIAVLLTNRVHPSRQHTAIKAFRPKLHDAVMQGFKGS